MLLKDLFAERAVRLRFEKDILTWKSHGEAAIGNKHEIFEDAALTSHCRGAGTCPVDRSFPSRSR